MLLSNAFDKVHNFKAGRGVESGGRFVQEKQLWAAHELARNADSSLLPTTDSFADRGTDDCFGLVLEPKCSEQGLGPLLSLCFAHGAIVFSMEEIDGSVLSYPGSESFPEKCIVSLTVSEPTSESSCST